MTRRKRMSYGVAIATLGVALVITAMLFAWVNVVVDGEGALDFVGAVVVLGVILSIAVVDYVAIGVLWRHIDGEK